MKFSFHEAAQEEIFLAIEYYEECQPGLGKRFSDEVFASIPKNMRISPCMDPDRSKNKALFNQ